MDEKQQKKIDFLLAERLEAAALRLEMANAKTEELAKAQEEMRSREILGGGTPMTITPIKKEETAKEYKDRVLKGQL